MGGGGGTQQSRNQTVERCRWKQPARCSHVGEAPAFSHRSLSLHPGRPHERFSSRRCFSGPQRQMSPDRPVLLHGWMSKKPAAAAMVDVKVLLQHPPSGSGCVCFIYVCSSPRNVGRHEVQACPHPPLGLHRRNHLLHLRPTALASDPDPVCLFLREPKDPSASLLSPSPHARPLTPSANPELLFRHSRCN